MKLGIVIYSNDTELAWNAFRLANFGISEKDETTVLLLAKGVGYENLSNEKYNILGQPQKYINNGEKILAYETCLKLREKDGTELCPVSTMNELYQMIRESDKVVSF